MSQLTEPSRITVNEAAKYLGVTASFLNKLRVSGDGPTYIKIGRRVVYDTRDLDRWLASKRRYSTRQPRLVAKNG